MINGRRVLHLNRTAFQSPDHPLNNMRRLGEKKPQKILHIIIPHKPKIGSPVLTGELWDGIPQRI